jgi:hypothetical protein
MEISLNPSVTDLSRLGLGTGDFVMYVKRFTISCDWILLILKGETLDLSAIA